MSDRAGEAGVTGELRVPGGVLELERARHPLLTVTVPERAWAPGEREGLLAAATVRRVACASCSRRVRSLGLP